MAKVLTKAAVEAAKPDPQKKRREIPDGGLPGLYLVVQPSGAKSWAVRYRYAGKPKKHTLDRYPKVTLADAREKARDALKAVDRGENPAATKREKRNADSFEALAEDFLKRHADKLRTGEAVRRVFDVDVLPHWRGRKAEDITRRDVIDLLDGIVDRGAPVQANRTLAAIRKMFNWAVSRDRLPGSPCAGVKPPAPERTRDRILTDAELGAFWKATAAMGHPFGPLLRLLLLTGQRRDEVGEMRWREIDDATWTIPASRAKNGKEQAVHLSDPALVVLAKVPRIKNEKGRAEWVFTTTGDTPVSGWTRAKARVDKLMAAEIDAPVPHWTFHDLRRTCASGMARAGVDLPAIERCLNHVSGSFAGVAGIYNRHTYADEMRAAWDAWGRLVTTLVEGKPENVVDLRAAQ